MYAAKAFAIRKVIREILVEQLSQEGFGPTYNIDGEEVNNLESWMLDVSRAVQDVSDIHKDLEGEAKVMQTLIKSPQTSSETSGSPETGLSPEC